MTSRALGPSSTTAHGSGLYFSPLHFPTPWTLFRCDCTQNTMVAQAKAGFELLILLSRSGSISGMCNHTLWITRLWCTTHPVLQSFAKTLPMQWGLLFALFFVASPLTPHFWWLWWGWDTRPYAGPCASTLLLIHIPSLSGTFHHWTCPMVCVFPQFIVFLP